MPPKRKSLGGLFDLGFPIHSRVGLKAASAHLDRFGEAAGARAGKVVHYFNSELADIAQSTVERMGKVVGGPISELARIEGNTSVRNVAVRAHADHQLAQIATRTQARGLPFVNGFAHPQRPLDPTRQPPVILPIGPQPRCLVTVNNLPVALAQPGSVLNVDVPLQLYTQYMIWSDCRTGQIGVDQPTAGDPHQSAFFDAGWGGPYTITLPPGAHLCKWLEINGVAVFNDTCRGATSPTIGSPPPIIGSPGPIGGTQCPVCGTCCPPPPPPLGTSCDNPLYIVICVPKRKPPVCPTPTANGKSGIPRMK